MGKDQLFVYTYKGHYPNTKSPGHTYKDIIKQLKNQNGSNRKLSEKEIAKMILDSLDKSPKHQKGIWKDFSPDQKRAAVDFIAITMIAEAVPPLVPGKSGRVPGMDRAARGHLEEITEGKSTFTEAFVGNDADYIPARKGGTQAGRTYAGGETENYNGHFPSLSDSDKK
nr:PREDICTED: uncharacterized protein LOC102362837 [Latimeria chalumnae]|eukprot:XP_014339316.1 PREDICTED: uncharacterized protein LOC102362837 [Latimeria chalumnae]